ncbi:GlxA family transcriptional regulator [Halomonas sp. BN3-1]|uniref:choline metabolism transcriptional regulator GbdR n=1 Tax=Halomonas sp. BN3-1 TaxID=2082393 RepID=UPI000D37213B|nr:GlxA family transcriptional regulator [Halomonas sp. BN3-1]
MTMTLPSRPEGPQTVGFLLLEHFTLISLASAIEPLRMANQLSGQELYRWFTLSLDGAPLQASDGLTVTPDSSITVPLSLDMVVVCGGVAPTRHVHQGHVSWLKAQARHLKRFGSVCTGAWALARAGLLEGYEVSTHWKCQAALQEAYPGIGLTSKLFAMDRDRFTCSGGTAPLDMMLTLIGRDHGRELAAGISDMFVCDRVRGEQDQQRVPLKHMLGTTQPRLQEIVALMENNLEEPIDLDELARYVSLSRRQLERLFQRNLHCSPSRYYMRLRLNRARQLLKQTSMSIIDIAAACGFVSTPHFSKCYRECFGLPPREERLGWSAFSPVVAGSTVSPLLAAAPDEPVSRALSALEEARGEPTYGSFKVLPK